MTERWWWQRHSGLLERELEALEQDGIDHELIESARDELQRIELRVTLEVRGRTCQLRVVYPDLYPFFRPEVFWDDVQLERHQHPFQRNLCLLPSGTQHWKPRDTLADVLRPQLEKLLLVNEDPSATAVKELEAAQGEPYSHYYPYERPSALLVDGSWELPPGVDHGRLVIRYNPEAWVQVEDDDAVPLVRGVVAEIQDPKRNILCRFNEQFANRYTASAVGRWVRVDQPPAEKDPTQFAQVLEQRLEQLSSPGSKPVKITQRRSRGGRRTRPFDLAAAVFPEEVAWRETGDGWVGVARFLSGRHSGNYEHSGDDHFVRMWRAGPEDLKARIPELRPLADKTVALVGLGGLGAPLALEIAKAGVGSLRLLDHDVVDPATAVRWPAGPQAAGQSKVQALKARIARQAPYASIEQLHLRRLGGVRARSVHAKTSSDQEVIGQLLTGADIVVDATAELGVQHFLSTAARQRSLPYICCSGTQGAWGGVLIRVPADNGGCWSCSMAHLKQMGTAPADPDGTIEPAGCGDPTFTGAHFDLLPVVAEAARLVAGELTPSSGAYPDLAWDIALVELRNTEGQPCPPTWRTRQLTTHQDCTRSDLHQ